MEAEKPEGLKQMTAKRVKFKPKKLDGDGVYVRYICKCGLVFTENVNFVTVGYVDRCPACFLKHLNRKGHTRKPWKRIRIRYKGFTYRIKDIAFILGIDKSLLSQRYEKCRNIDYMILTKKYTKRRLVGINNESNDESNDEKAD